MPVAPSRWHLIELRRTRDAVRSGIDLLDRKREALVRELLSRAGLATERRGALATALNGARRSLARALVDIGRQPAEAAGLAQPAFEGLDLRQDHVLGVALPRLTAHLISHQIAYGPGGTSASLDAAGRAFADLLPLLVAVAAEETAVRNLQAALRRTTRTLNALKDVMLPRLDGEIRTVADTLDEEERDERLRRRTPASSV
jgi:V/A-type H+-transporting ATPase subunit D